MMYYVILVAAIALDQLIKYIVRTNMILQESIPVINDIFHITYIHNYGAAFSILNGQRWILIAVTGVALIAITVYMIKLPKNADKLFKLSLALIVSGGIGNLIDRALFGYVVDFLDFRVWPIFNVADIAVCVGCALLVIYVIFIDGKRNKDVNERS